MRMTSIFHVSTHITVNNLVILGIFNDLENFLDGPINVSANTTNENGVFSSAFASFNVKLDHERLVFANDPT